MIGNLVGKKANVLDHGFVELVDFMGSDAAILQSARISTGAKASKGASQDRSLIRHLMRARHTSPFEMCEIKLRVKMPIFVARQWIRHRTANVNEVSARYTKLPEEFYVPDAAQVQAQSTDNRQGRGDSVSDNVVKGFRYECDQIGTAAFDGYQGALDHGISRELARINLPLSTYTEWFWKIDLHNLLHFLKLRLDPHAQWEIRQYAEAIADIVKVWTPLTWEAFNDYVAESHTFSKQEMELLRGFLADAPDAFEAMLERQGGKLSDREKKSFVNAIFPEN